MSNYSQINLLRGKLTALFRVPDMVAWLLSGTAMVGRSSVSQVVEGAATLRALIKSHALPRTSVAVVRSRGSA